MRPNLRTSAVVVVAVMGLGGIAACGADDAPVCQSMDALRSSVDHLKDVNVGENALSEAQSRAAQVKQDLLQVKSDAGEQYAAEIIDIQQAATDLQSTVDAAKAAPSQTTFDPLKSAIFGMGASITALDQAISVTC